MLCRSHFGITTEELLSISYSITAEFNKLTCYKNTKDKQDAVRNRLFLKYIHVIRKETDYLTAGTCQLSVIYAARSEHWF